MKTLKIIPLLLFMFLSQASKAQDDEDLNFDDFPDLESFMDDDSYDDASDVTDNISSSSSSTDINLPVEEAVPQNNVLSLGTRGDEEDVVPVNPLPNQLRVTAPRTSTNLDGAPTNLGDFGPPSESLFSNETQYPDDIRDLERRLKDAESSHSSQSARRSEPGEDLPPPEQFSRVPLGPPMSDANWLRWAGPMSTKEYKIRRGDSLWAVSERLFGNPYLWPKIWHLNASITNPHIIERGMVLSFNPGNPSSAPELAYKPGVNDYKGIGLHPLTKFDKKKTLLETIDEALRKQIAAPHPPFQFFLLDNKPRVLGSIPAVPTRTGKRFWLEGDSFRTKLADGVFPIIRSEVVREKATTAYRVHWVGTIRVQAQRAVVEKSFVEIREGDEVVQRRFMLSPLAVHNDSLGPKHRDDTYLVPVQAGTFFHGGTGQMMGVRFPATGLGPRAGALLEIQVGHNRRAKALLVDRDQRMGTLWILDGDNEVSITDKIF